MRLRILLMLVPTFTAWYPFPLCSLSSSSHLSTSIATVLVPLDLLLTLPFSTHLPLWITGFDVYIGLRNVHLEPAKQYIAAHPLFSKYLSASSFLVSFSIKSFFSQVSSYPPSSTTRFEPVYGLLTHFFYLPPLILIPLLSFLSLWQPGSLS
jgi:hypothetical protein